MSQLRPVFVSPISRSSTTCPVESPAEATQCGQRELGARQLPGGRHRTPQRSIGEVLAPVVGSAPAIGGIAGSLSVAAATLLPGVAAATPISANTSSGQPAAETVLVAVPASAAFAAPSDDDLARLRMCESTDNYSIATGNGYYGAYQFDAGTWRGLGLPGLPQQSPPELQDAAAAALEQTRGWEPWPACSSHLGLVPQRAHHLPVSQVVGTLTPTTSAAPVVVAKPAAPVKASGPSSVHSASAPTHVTTPPPFPGHVLSAADAGTYRSDVRTWQQRMAARGWQITADGYFGPATQAVARAFAAEKHLSDGFPGEVGAKVWAAAWTSPLD